MFEHFKKRILLPLLSLLRMNNSPAQIAHAVSLGLLMGIFPIYGTSTPLCFVFAYIFRLNPTAIQLANYAMYPFQFILLIPFIQLGVWIMGWTVDSAFLEQIAGMLATDFCGALSEVGNLLLAGALAWLLVSAVLYGIIYRLSLWYFTRKLSAEVKKAA